MSDHLGLIRVVLGVLFQFGQIVLDLSLDTAPSWGRLSVVGRVKVPVQFHHPVAVAFESLVLRREGVVALNHGQQLIQKGMPPFFRLRWSEASRRARSSKDAQAAKFKERLAAFGERGTDQLGVSTQTAVTGIFGGHLAEHTTGGVNRRTNRLFYGLFAGLVRFRGGGGGIAQTMTLAGLMRHPRENMGHGHPQGLFIITDDTPHTIAQGLDRL